MNIREWFGCPVQYDASSNFNKSLDTLLKLYAEAVSRYFALLSVKDLEDLLTKVSASHMSKGQQLFLEWFQTKGLFSLKKLVNITNVQDEEVAVAEINYEIYILEDEMDDFSYPEDVRAILISISNDLESTLNQVSTTREIDSQSRDIIGTSQGVRPEKVDYNYQLIANLVDTLKFYGNEPSEIFPNEITAQVDWSKHKKNSYVYLDKMALKEEIDSHTLLMTVKADGVLKKEESVEMQIPLFFLLICVFIVKVI